MKPVTPVTHVTPLTPVVGSLRGRHLLAAALTSLAVVGLVTGCGAGRGAQTGKAYAAADGTQARRGDIQMLNAVIVTPGAAGAAVVSTTVSNRSTKTDEIIGVTADGTAATLSGDSSVPANGVLRFGGGYGTQPSGQVAAAQAQVTGLRARAGDVVTLSVMLQQSGTISFAVPVVAASGIWASAIPQPSAG